MRVAQKNPVDRTAVFGMLKQLFAPYAGKLHVAADTKGQYQLETVDPVWKGRRLYFGGVAVRKSYVSFHLIPVYMFPDLLVGMSPGLRKRMQGKSCFNFSTADEQLFRELGKLVDAGFRKFRSAKPG